jgi:SAM-dependent methyltransferase
MAKPAAPSVTPQRLLQMAWGYAPALVVQAGIEVGVFAALSAGPCGLEDVAAVTGAAPRGLRALLNALVGMELLRREGAAYALTPEAAAFLVPSSPRYVGGSFRHAVRQLVPAWLHLTEAVRTGRPATTHRQADDGAAFFNEFVESLALNNAPAARALAAHLSPDGVGEGGALDLGAGGGVWGIALAERVPGLRVTALDWPGVLETTRRVVARHGLSERFDFLAGDVMTAPLGEGWRYAVLGHVLHSLGETDSRRLLARLHAALRPGGVLAIAEFLPNEDHTGPLQPLLFAVNMLVLTAHGDTWPFAEIARWLGEAGFVNPRLVDVPAPSPLILADRP